MACSQISHLQGANCCFLQRWDSTDLTDKHNPTSRTEIKKLVLFRCFKDPAILSPQFHPLYLRLGFPGTIDPSNASVENIEKQANELVGFVRALNMGSFYAQQLEGYLV